MLKSNLPLDIYLQQHFEFASTATGDELSIHDVFRQANHYLKDFHPISDVEKTLASLANKAGYEPTRSFIYLKKINQPFKNFQP